MKEGCRILKDGAIELSGFEYVCVIPQEKRRINYKSDSEIMMATWPTTIPGDKIDSSSVFEGGPTSKLSTVQVATVWIPRGRAAQQSLRTGPPLREAQGLNLQPEGLQAQEH